MYPYLFGIIYTLIIQLLLASHTLAIPTVPIVDEYVTLSKLCNDGTEDTVSLLSSVFFFQTPRNFQSPNPTQTPSIQHTNKSPTPHSLKLPQTKNFSLLKIQYVAVLFANNERKTYKYGECYPYSIGESKAVQAVFCKLAFCVGKSYVSPSSPYFCSPQNPPASTPKFSHYPLHPLLPPSFLFPFFFPPFFSSFILF